MRKIGTGVKDGLQKTWKDEKRNTRRKEAHIIKEIPEREGKGDEVGNKKKSEEARMFKMILQITRNDAEMRK